MCARSLCPSVKVTFVVLEESWEKWSLFPRTQDVLVRSNPYNLSLKASVARNTFIYYVFGLVRVTFFEIIVVLWIDISWFSYHHLTCRQISSIHLKLLIRAINNKKNIYKKSHFPWNWLLSLHNWAKCTRTKKISRYIANISALIENSNCNAAVLPLELFIKAIKQLCEHVSGSKWVNIYFIKN